MSKTVLVVDKNEKDRKLVRVIIENMGCHVLEAKDGKEALDLAREHIPKLILMEVRLPVIDGIKAAEILKSDESTAGIPLVALTSCAMTGDREKLLSEGFDGYISKPINLDEFIETANKYACRDHAADMERDYA